MEGIAHLVSASLARHGFTTQLDHRRLQWSKWLPCESSFSVLLVPSKPGVFALAEEEVADTSRLVSGHRFRDAVIASESMAPFGTEAAPQGQQSGGTSPQDDKRVLTLFRISETEDLGMALGSLFLLNTPERDRSSRKPCYVRYAVIEDDDQRRAAYRSLHDWMASPSQSSSEIPDNLAVHNFTAEEEIEGGSKSAA